MADHDFIDGRIVMAKGIIDAVMQAAHAPCSEVLEHEDALWGACELLDEALKRLRDETN